MNIEAGDVVSLQDEDQDAPDFFDVVEMPDGKLLLVGRNIRTSIALEKTKVKKETK